ncbi:hypothetical protein HDU89_006842 [Geranomyces variabilis]|nr:hypothetical protein HDU89_006842 [Geranomyces variabilis]
MTTSLAWQRSPVFFNRTGPLASDVQAPAGLASTVATRWKEIIKTFPTLSIAESVSGVAPQSIIAADRYRKLKPIANSNPSWALPTVLLAETHFLLNELHGARRLLERARAVVGVGADTVLDQAILHVQELADVADLGDEDDESELVVKRYKRPVALTCPTSTGPRVDDSLARWQRLQTQKTVDVAIEQFARNAALQTNVLEGVFALDGQSWPLLVRRGFFENSIAGFSRLSKIKKPKKVIEILKNTNECMAELIPVLQDSSQYNDAFVQTVHAKLMQNDDVVYEEDDEDRYAILIPSGEYRRVACYTTHDEKGYETRFCPWKSLTDDMEWYFAAAREVLANRDINPFLAAAWLQFAFLRIHPFSDGNGRVSRIISSIPLIMANLPPVVVAASRKSAYFDALNNADETGDCAALATYLKEEMDQAMEDIANLSVDLAVEIPGSPASSTSEAPSTPSPLQNVIAAVEALRV